MINSIKLISWTLLFDCCTTSVKHTHANTLTQRQTDRNSRMCLSSHRAQACLQLVSCHLPGEKLHQKDFPKRNRRTAHGWPGTIKRRRKKWNTYRERGSRGCEEEKAEADMAKWDTKTAWEAVQRRCSRTPGDGQPQHRHNFHSSVCTPRWLGRNDGYSNWPFVSPVSHDLSSS